MYFFKMSEVNHEIVRKYDGYYMLVAPDGGWGYMIAISLVIVMFLVVGPLTCFGLLYNDFIESYNISVTGVTTANGLGNSVYFLFAFLCSIFLKRWTLRQVGMTGAVLFSIGNLGIVFMNSLFTMTLAFLINCIGGGLMDTCIYTVFSMYFEKKRVNIMIICQTIISIMLTAFPPLIQFTMQTFGFRGTMALIFAAGLHSIFAFIAVQPVENHMRLEEINLKEYGLPEELELLSSKEKKALVGSDSKKLEKVKCQRIAKQSKLKRMSDFFDLSVLQDPAFVNICIGMSVVVVADFNFIAVLPLHLYEESWTEDQVAFMLTLIQMGDIVARVALVVISKFFEINSRIMFLSGVAILFIIRIIILNSHDVMIVTGITTIMGAMRCLNLVTYSLIIADAVPISKYADAQGLVMLVTGVLSVITGPITGALKDMTGNYLACFHMMNGMLLVCVIPWTIELVIKFKKHQNNRIIKRGA